MRRIIAGLILFGLIILSIVSGLSIRAVGQTPIRGSLIDFYLEPSDTTVGENAVYDIFFSNENLIPSGGRFYFDFMQGFGFGSLDSINIIAEGEPLTEFIDQYTVENQKIKIAMSPSMPIIPSNSSVQVTMDYLVNDTASGEHIVIGWTTTYEDSMIDGPAISQSFDLAPDELHEIFVTPNGNMQLRAGSIVSFSATTRDQYGNPIDDLIIQWAVEPDSCGIVNTNGVFIANKIGTCVVTASALGVTGYSGEITIIPGEFGGINMMNIPQQVVAGNGFPDSVGLLVVDVMNNRKTDFTGEVYFSSTDPQADVYWDENNPYLFTEADSGLHYFDPDGFILRTAGYQNLIINHGIWFKESPLINVLPADIAFFDIPAITDSVIVGADFDLVVENVVDSFENATSGLIRVTGYKGVRNAPNGSPPILRDVSVTNGNGRSPQRLVAVDSAVLQLSTPLFTDTTNTIPVYPGGFNQLHLNISSPQVTGEPFTHGELDSTVIIAYDFYLNRKTDFDASLDSNAVSLYPRGNGVMINNIFDQPDDFVDGVCDLAAHETTYIGQGGWNEFWAAAADTSVDTSRTSIYVLSLELHTLELEQDYLFMNDTASVYLGVFNPLQDTLSIDSVFVVLEYEGIYEAYCVPNLPDLLPGSSERTYMLSFIAPWNTDSLYSPINCHVHSSFDDINIFSEFTAAPDTGYFAGHKLIDVHHESLNPDSVIVNHLYSFAVDVENSFESGILLDDSSTLFITDNLDHYYTAEISSATRYIPPNQKVTRLVFDSTAFPLEFQKGSYKPVLNLHGIVRDYPYLDEELLIDHDVTVNVGSYFTYTYDSVQPDSVVAGFPAVFQVEVINVGTFPVTIDSSGTILGFSDGLHDYEAKIDVEHETYDGILESGKSLLYFMEETVSDSMLIGRYEPWVRLKGIQNEIPVDTTIYLNRDSIDVISPGLLHVDGFYPDAPNPPYINIGQRFDLQCLLRNSGQDGIENIIVSLRSDGQSEFPDTLFVDFLPGLMDTPYVYIYEVTADSITGSENFIIKPSGGMGQFSGAQVQINIPPGNDSYLVTKQTPAEINIAGFDVVNSDTDPDTVSIGRRFSVESVIVKSGQSELSGNMQVILDEMNAFTAADSIQRDFGFESSDTAVVGWDVFAPLTPGSSYQLGVGFAGNILDSNDGSNAVGADSIGLCDIVVVPGAYMYGFMRITEPEGAVDEVLSTNQFFTLTDSIFINGDMEDATANLELPAGYSTVDSLSKSLIGDSIAVIDWQIQAPAVPDDAIKTLTVRLNAIDKYSGDELEFYSSLGVKADEAANLRPDFYVKSPESALDHILDPQQEFTLGFNCDNIGEVGVIPGSVRLLNPGGHFIITSDTVRSFGENEEILFDIRAPSYELSNPVDLYIDIFDIPDDSNSNQDAVISSVSLELQFVVKDLKPDLIVEGYQGFSGQGLVATEIDALKLFLFNKDNGSGYPVEITDFELFACDQDGAEISFDQLAAQATVRNNPDNIAPGEITGNSAIFSELGGFRIDAGFRDTITFSLELGDELSLPGFSVRINSSGIRAYAIRDGIPQMRVNVESPTGDEIDILTNPAGLSTQNLAESFGNYPNPFDPLQELTTFSYYLSSQSDISLRVYSLTGQPVWSAEYRGSDEHCLAGNHSGGSTLPPITWNGRNHRGYVVNNGIYIAVFSVRETGEEVRTKVAVVK